VRLITLAAALAFGTALAACGGDEAAAPLTLQERVPGTAEAPGSEADPVETQRTLTGLEDLESEFLAHESAMTEEDISQLGEAGFVSMVIDTRWYPSEPGAEHAPPGVPEPSPHLFTLVGQFESAEGASAAVELTHNIGLRPCPETCAFDISEFEVAGLPDAKGAQAIATQESIDRVGDDLEPRATYSIYFADGPFAYEVTLGGPPEEVSQQQAEEIAKKLYERVAGAPLPEPA
jgi:hypothetical protein